MRVAPAVFSYGFRPFFLLAGVAAAVLVPAWALDYVFGIAGGSRWPPTLWHAHEMLYGFVPCAIAGFLLTAVPSWTGHKGFAGRPLVVLAVLWLLGRVATATNGSWPAIVPPIIDLAFIPALAVLIAGPLLRARNRNTPLLGVLALYWLTDVGFQYAVYTHNPPQALHVAQIGVDVLLVLVTVVGGRIVPAFTSSALRTPDADAGIRSSPALTGLAITAMLLLTLVDLFAHGTAAAGLVAALAALIQAVRMAQWGALRTARLPIVWILHLGYLWLPVGLALEAVALLTGAAYSAFWLHALTVGALSTMILAVMTRAALGHTGRPLRVSRPTVIAYLLLLAATITRVFGLALLPLPYPLVILLSAILWTAAFGLYLWVYAPILCAPRADGRSG